MMMAMTHILELADEIGEGQPRTMRSYLQRKGEEVAEKELEKAMREFGPAIQIQLRT